MVCRGMQYYIKNAKCTVCACVIFKIWTFLFCLQSPEPAYIILEPPAHAEPPAPLLTTFPQSTPYTLRHGSGEMQLRPSPPVPIPHSLNPAVYKPPPPQPQPPSIDHLILNISTLLPPCNYTSACSSRASPPPSHTPSPRPRKNTPRTIPSARTKTCGRGAKANHELGVKTRAMWRLHVRPPLLPSPPITNSVKKSEDIC